MSTKRTLYLIYLVGALMPLFLWLGSRKGAGVFIVLAIICSFVGIGLMFYAAFREKAYDDKSESVSARAAATILCVVGFWVVFVFYRALAH